MILLAKLKAWALGILAFAAMVLAAFLLGRRKGGQQQKQADTVASATQTIHAHEVRQDVETETAKLPDAPAQKVADAAPATAAGRLRDDGWTRD